MGNTDGPGPNHDNEIRKKLDEIRRLIDEIEGYLGTGDGKNK